MAYAKLMGSVNVKVDGQGLTVQQVKLWLLILLFTKCTHYLLGWIHEIIHSE
jgi:hypothetical protein